MTTSELTRKEWLYQTHGIGNGGGRGRISREGHALITKAIADGMTFKDTSVISTGAKPKTPKAPADTTVIDEPYSAADVRKWANDNGITVAARGRIDSKIVRQYLDTVPKADREAVELDVYRDGTPRTYPEGQTFTVFYTSIKGESKTLVVNDRTVCMKCRVSLGHCGCGIPGPVAVGCEDTTKPVTVRAN